MPWRAPVSARAGCGQNFLVQPALADCIVAAANLRPTDEVLEIGPGLGILSERIAAHPLHRVVLVELRLAARGRARGLLPVESEP